MWSNTRLACFGSCSFPSAATAVLYVRSPATDCDSAHRTMPQTLLQMSMRSGRVRLALPGRTPAVAALSSQASRRSMSSRLLCVPTSVFHAMCLYGRSSRDAGGGGARRRDGGGDSDGDGVDVDVDNARRVLPPLQQHPLPSSRHCLRIRRGGGGEGSKTQAHRAGAIRRPSRRCIDTTTPATAPFPPVMTVLRWRTTKWPADKKGEEESLCRSFFLRLSKYHGVVHALSRREARGNRHGGAAASSSAVLQASSPSSIRLRLPLSPLSPRVLPLLPPPRIMRINCASDGTDFFSAFIVASRLGTRGVGAGGGDFTAAAAAARRPSSAPHIALACPAASSSPPKLASASAAVGLSASAHCTISPASVHRSSRAAQLSCIGGPASRCAAVRRRSPSFVRQKSPTPSSPPSTRVRNAACPAWHAGGNVPLGYPMTPASALRATVYPWKANCPPGAACASTSLRHSSLSTLKRSITRPDSSSWSVHPSANTSNGGPNAPRASCVNASGPRYAGVPATPSEHIADACGPP
eukprot:Rhum_TRINITY_DN12538_c0_g2::Rhum_TRINITY_DN12538_c0_g2_i1::g.52843::m.52843